MRSTDDVRARLCELFSEELAGHTATMSQRLAALESEDAQPPTAAIGEFFRSAHSLKGAAMAAGYPAVESLCQAMETVLAKARDGRRRADPVVLDALRHGLDALHAARAPVAADEPLDLPALEAARRRITDAAATLPAAPGLPPAAPLRLPAEHLDGLLDRAGEVLAAARVARRLREPVDTALEDFSRQHRRWRRRRGGLEEALRAGRTEAGLAALEEADRAWLAVTESLGSIADSLHSGLRTLHRCAASLGEEARRAGMLPFSAACEELDAVVQDAARATGKRARLVVKAADVRVDRAVLDALREPLVHLVRRGVDHGIERPEQRQAAGKPPDGVVSIAAAPDGEGLRVVVADDGGGSAEDPARPEGAKPGLDLVGRRIEALGGSVTVTSRPGQGTEVQLLVPASAATLPILVARVAGHDLGLPLASARRVLRITADDVEAGGDGPRGGGAVLNLAGRTVPIVDLAAVLPGRGHSTGLSPMAIVVEAGDDLAGLLIDAVTAEEEVVIRPAAGPDLAGGSLTLGTAVLPDGRTITVLDPASLLTRDTEGLTRDAEGCAGRGRARRVLVAEASLTTRALERGTLEWAGYEVLSAADGSAAWRLLNDRGADLVLADVSLPIMDGLELCRWIRASARFRRVPVVLVATVANDDDRRRGVEAGADAYLIKTSFDEGELLDTIARLL